MFTQDRKLVIFVASTTIILAVLGYAWKQRTSIPFVTVPLERVATPFVYGSDAFLKKITTGIGLLDAALHGKGEMAELEQANADLKQQLITDDEVKAENIRLRQMLNYKNANVNLDMVAARVIMTDFGSWTNTMVIDRGANDGIAVNMAVVVPSGVVGVVTDVYPDSARVQTIIDPRSAIGVIVQRPESRVASVIKGNGNDPTSPTLVNVAKDGDVLTGDMLVTSGYGGIFPKGLPVGHVTNIVNDPEGFVKNASVETTVDFRKVEDVFVIRSAVGGMATNSSTDVKLVPQTQRDQVEGARGAITPATPSSREKDTSDDDSNGASDE